MTGFHPVVLATPLFRHNLVPFSAPATAVTGDTGGDIRASFRAAVQQHTAAGGRGDIATPAGGSESGGEEEGSAEGGDDDEPAPAPARRAATRRAAPVVEPEVEGDEEAEGGEESEPNGNVEETPTGRARGTDGRYQRTATDGELISDEEFRALQEQHADNPDKLRKALVGQFTKKTQALAEKRRSVERLERYVPLIDDLEADPEATIRALAAQHGLTDLTPRGEDGEADAEDAPLTAEQLTTDVRELLGSDYDYLAEPLAKVVGAMLEKYVPKAAERIVQPLRGQTRALLQRTAEQLSADTMRTFQQRHADWEDHEPAMVALMQRVQPNGMTEAEYLDFIYENARRVSAPADDDARIEREVAARMKKRIAKMNAGESSQRPNPTPEGEVRKRPSGPVSFEQAAKDAMRGIRYDDED